MKNDVLVDVPATISLTPLSVVTSHPSGRANSRRFFPPFPPQNYWWFFKSVKQASRPQSHSPPSSPSSLFPACFLSFTPEAASFYPCGVRRPKGSSALRNRLAPCYLFFKLFAFCPTPSFILAIRVQKWKQGKHVRCLSPRWGKCNNVKYWLDYIKNILLRLRRYTFNSYTAHNSSSTIYIYSI